VARTHLGKLFVADFSSKRILTDKLRMHVLEWAGAEPPIVFLHHFTGNSLSALTLGELLAGKRRLIAPDLRGRGQSDMPAGDYGIALHVKDVMTCLDRMGVDQFVAAGHSFGATISLFMAAQYPQRVSGLILFDGGAMPSEEAIQFFEGYYDTLQYRYESDAAYVARYRNAPLYQPWTDALERLVRSNLYQQPDGTFIRRVPRYVLDADRRSEQLETWKGLPELYPQVACPVLVLRAEMGIMGVEDQLLPDPVIATMQAGMPTSTVVTIMGAGHTSLLTIPSRERDEAILNFLGLSS